MLENFAMVYYTEYCFKRASLIILNWYPNLDFQMDVSELDLKDQSVREDVLWLQRDAFSKFPDEWFVHIIDHPSLSTIGYGIYEASDLVAVNIFIAHSVHRNGETGIAYQSCMSATRRDQKGKGCFSRIIEHAKEDLNNKGAKFIFGFPNANSGPIFVKKLGFSLSSNMSSLTFSTPLFRIGGYDGEELSHALAANDLTTFDYRDAAAWKAKFYGEDLFECEDLTNYLFGRVVSRKRFGLSTKLLIVGGAEINKPHLVNNFFAKAMRASNAKAIRIVSNSSGPFVKAARFKRGLKTTEPLIAFSLNWQVDASRIEALTGLKDVY